MSLAYLCRVVLLMSLLLLVRLGQAAPAPVVIDLWPGDAPGDKGGLAAEGDLTKPTDGLIAGKPVIRLGNVARPTLTIYRPDPAKDTGATIVVFPGGGYHILAMDLEGTEVCEWLTSIGITGVLVKYRVPKREGLPRHAAPLQDAQRSLGLVRQQAPMLGFDPNRIGVLGFSAGGHLAAAVSCNYAERSYPSVDEADGLSCRPDFTVLIYPGYLTVKEEGDKVAPELRITEKTPPTFLVMAQDDSVRMENAVFYALALKNAKVPMELHIYPTGGHGYGLRPSEHLVTTWPKRVEEWLGSQGFLRPKGSSGNKS